MFYLKSESGFTLLEIILGTAVLGILAVSVMGYWHTSTGALEDMQAHQIATELAKNSIEKMKAKAGNLSSTADFKSELTTIADSESTTITDYRIDFNREISISDYNSHSFQQQVEATVSWQDSQVTLDTIVTDKRNKEYALNFDGIDDYVEINDSDSLDMSAPFTVEFWFRANSRPTTFPAVPVAKGTYTDENEFVWWFEYLPNGDLEFSINYKSGSPRTVKVNLENNKWYHLAGVYDGSKQQLYLNGNLKNSIDSSGEVLNNDYPLLLSFSHGDDVDYSEYTACQLKELRVWETDRSNIDSTNKIDKFKYEDLSGGELGLVGYWKLNEGSGDIVYDYAGGNNGKPADDESLNYQKVFWDN
ncbi:MAG: LamG-like jellyroll fold domain-containing protein [Bacillota bacterium]